MKQVFIAAALLCTVVGMNAQTIPSSLSFDPISATTIAGTGTSGFADGPPGSAQFTFAPGIITMNGNIYVADAGNNRIRKISADGTVTTYAGTGVAGSVDGPAATAQFSYPFSICADKSGNIYVNDYGAFAIRKITPGGMVSTILKAGTGAAAAYSYFSAYMAMDANDNIYLSKSNNVLKVSAGAISVLAANVGENPGSFELQGLAVDPLGNVYVNQYFNRTLKISAAGIVTTGFAMPPGTLSTGLSTDKSGNLYLSTNTNPETNGNIVTKLSPGAKAGELAGNNNAGYLDATGSSAQFSSASSFPLSADDKGNVYIMDKFRVRKLSAPILHLLTTPGVASPAAYFSISGISLNGAATIQAPSYYEFSVNPGGPFTNSLNIAPVANEINGVKIYVRLAANASNGSHIDSISLTAAGVATQKLAITGVVSAGNPPPVSNPGGNTSIALPVSTATLDASASYDPDGSISQYYWSQAQGPVNTTIGNNFAKTTTVSGLTTTGTYIFVLQVKDNNGQPSWSSKTVTVTPANQVPACVTNLSPANGSTLSSQTSATLTWQASPGATSYEVYFAPGTALPTQPVFSTSALSYSPSGITAGGTYTWFIVPRNAVGRNTSCSTNVSRFTAAPPGNQPVVANAGADTTIYINGNVRLDARASTGGIVQYYWYQISGPNGTVITNNFSALTNATVFSYTGKYVFGLQVKDVNGVPKYATKTVTVTGSAARLADASSLVNNPDFAKTAVASLPSISAVVGPNPVRTGQIATVQINSSKAGVVMINTVNSSGMIIASKKLNLATGINTTTVNTAGLAQGFHVISINGAEKPINLKLVVQ